METAWELLAGETTDLAELTELIYESFTPKTAWATWRWVADGLYFNGSPTSIVVHQPEQVESIRNNRAAKEAERQAWEAFDLASSLRWPTKHHRACRATNEQATGGWPRPVR